MVASPHGGARHLDAGRSIQEIMKWNLLAAWLIAGAILGLAIDALWMLGLAHGIGVAFEFSMLFEELFLFLGCGFILGFLGYEINKGVSNLVRKAKPETGIEQSVSGDRVNSPPER